VPTLIIHGDDDQIGPSALQLTRPRTHQERDPESHMRRLTRSFRHAQERTQYDLLAFIKAEEPFPSWQDVARTKSGGENVAIEKVTMFIGTLRPSFAFKACFCQPSTVTLFIAVQLWTSSPFPACRRDLACGRQTRGHGRENALLLYSPDQRRQLGQLRATKARAGPRHTQPPM